MSTRRSNGKNKSEKHLKRKQKIDNWKKTRKVLIWLNIIVFGVIYVMFLHTSIVVPLVSEIFNRGPYYGERTDSVTEIPQQSFDEIKNIEKPKVKIFGIEQKNRIIHVNIMFDGTASLDEAKEIVQNVNTQINEKIRNTDEKTTLYEVQYVVNQYNQENKNSTGFPFFAMTAKGQKAIESFKINKN